MASCVRRAWLEVDGLPPLPFEDAAAGYFCESLDLGYPAPREVVNNRPDQHGTDDRTRYAGSRTITANIFALASAGAVIDAVATAFDRYMLPGLRPALHYVLERPGNPERVLIVRPAGYAWAVIGAEERDIQLQFVAPDPIATDPYTQTATAYAGQAGGRGRLYPRTFAHVYPPGPGDPTTGIIHSSGELPIQPLLRIFGPIRTPLVTITPFGPGAPFHVAFVPNFTITPGHYVTVDTDAKTAWLNTGASVITSLDWTTTTWPVLEPGGDNYLELHGSDTSNVTQVQARWEDRYLS